VELCDSSDHALACGPSHTVQAGKVDGRGSSYRTKPISRSGVAVVPERCGHERRRQPVGRDPGCATAAAGVVQVPRASTAAGDDVAAEACRRGRTERRGGPAEAVDGGQVVGGRFIVAGMQIERRLAGDGQMMVLMMMVVERRRCRRRQGVVLLVTFALHRRLSVARLDPVLLHRQRPVHLHSH